MRILLLTWLATSFFLLSFSPSGFTVKGKVVDEKGQPLEYVTVNEKGTKTSVAASEKGEFTITVSDAKAALVFSYVGFKQKTVKLKGRHELMVKLQITDEYEEDVIVTGHQKTVAADLTIEFTPVAVDSMAGNVFQPKQIPAQMNHQ